jgi:hypothetical protein
MLSENVIGFLLPRGEQGVAYRGEQVVFVTIVTGPWGAVCC